MNSPNENLHSMDQIAESFVAKLRLGQKPSIEQYKQRFPQFADEIEDVLPTLAMLEQCNASDPGAAPIYQAPPERIGDYRIVQEIGRGGMGVVYEAEHKSMQRRVALKLLSVAQSPNQLSRFYREARSAGNLHHSNIVPVFDVGCADGLHYYTMQFIRGQSLDLVIDEIKRLRGGGLQGNVEGTNDDGSGPVTDSLSRTVAMRMVSAADKILEKELAVAAQPAYPPLIASDGVSNREPSRVGSRADSVFGSSGWSSSGNSKQHYFRRIAAVGMQVADALGYAHHNGILHRDIKPANLILDMEGTVWILDFGLAKGDDDGLTQTGDIVGTLRYMAAPERFQGKSDARCDVYSLGLTLYEMCTLQHAFDESDRQSLLRQVATQDPKPPRQIDSSIPLDLETIILKAIERDPRRRYPSANQLVEDLQLFLMDRPIKARRISSAERLWRIARRNPAISAMATCIALLLLIVAFGASWFAVVSQQQMERSRTAENKAVAASREAQARNYELSYQRASSERRSGRPGQRYNTLATIAEASQLLPELNFDENRLRIEKWKLRNEAIAAMALFDVQETKSWSIDGDWTTAIGFSADFRWFAQSNTKGDIRIRHIEGKLPEIRIESPGHTAWRLEFSPDGKFLSTWHHPGSQPRKPNVYVWSLADPSTPLIALNENLTLASGHFFRDDATFAIQRKKSIDSFSLADGKLVTRFPASWGARKFKVAKDGRSIVISKSDGLSIEVWSMAPLPLRLHRIELPQKLTSIDWDSERQILVAGTRDGNVLVWRNGFERDPVSYKVHQDAITRLNLHPFDSRIASSSWDGFVRFFDLVSGQEEMSFEGYRLTNSGFSDDGSRIGFVDSERRFGIWRLPETPLTVLEQDVAGATSTNRQVHIHPKYKELVVTANTSRIEFWNAAVRKRLQVITGLQSTFVQFSPDGRWLYISGPDGFRRLPVDSAFTGDVATVNIGPPETVLDGATRRFDIRDDGKIAVVVVGSKPVVVNLGDKSIVARMGGHASVETVAISSTGKWVASGTWRGRGVRVWDAKTGELAKTLLPGSSSTTVAFSRDGSMLAAAGRESIALWSCDSWKPISHQLTRDVSNAVGRLKYSNNGSLLVANKTRYVLQLFAAACNEPLALFEAPHRERLLGYSFSNDQSRLAVSGRLFSVVWDLTRVRKELQTLNLDWHE